MFEEHRGYRTWGNQPFNTVLLHGGPGAAGSVSSLARELGQHIGLIEPFQTGMSIEAQLDELNEVIEYMAEKPVALIGHSWGAWLGFIFASHHPELVKKLILIGTPPFEEKQVSAMKKIREERISRHEKDRPYRITANMMTNPKDSFKMMGELMSKIDSYCLLPIHDEVDLDHINIGVVNYQKLIFVLWK
jgi:pimeloyl-ACP methyl ester carboxylesterase